MVQSNKDYLLIQIIYQSHLSSIMGLQIGKKLSRGFQSTNEVIYSTVHQDVVEKLAAKSSSVHIGVQLSTTEMTFHRTMLLKVLSCIRYLGRQGLALWGHDESIESFDGNLYQLPLLEAAGDDKMKA